MSKRKKRRTHASEEDATSRQATPVATRRDPKPAANVPRRIGLVLVIVTGSLWVGWLVFLTYVALSRH
ncbi:MAG: hypothetical protein QF918_05120 [Pirellulaceae bacterium]|nr:hypothetical protein [Pirellulaceae bacterium]MDP6553176.1 hypothetical protein [Pirellulaceae bacterium]MDP6723426.1 hypothetical protein [Pirellulaceae bacterium]